MKSTNLLTSYDHYLTSMGPPYSTSVLPPSGNPPNLVKCGAIGGPMDPIRSSPMSAWSGPGLCLPQKKGQVIPIPEETRPKGSSKGNKKWLYSRAPGFHDHMAREKARKFSPIFQGRKYIHRKLQSGVYPHFPASYGLVDPGVGFSAFWGFIRKGAG